MAIGVNPPSRHLCVKRGASRTVDDAGSIMMAMAEASAAREKFSSQTAPEALAALRQIAESQGRQFQVVLDEALRDYIDRQQKAPSCDDVKDDSLY
jgi:hypothetical protein